MHEIVLDALCDLCRLRINVLLQVIHLLAKVVLNVAHLTSVEATEAQVLAFQVGAFLIALVQHAVPQILLA